MILSKYTVQIQSVEIGDKARFAIEIGELSDL